jgi:hypothetical protein
MTRATVAVPAEQVINQLRADVRAASPAPLTLGDQLAAEDLRSEQAVRAEADQAATGDQPRYLDRVTVLGRRQRRGAGGDRAGRLALMPSC